METGLFLFQDTSYVLAWEHTFGGGGQSREGRKNVDRGALKLFVAYIGGKEGYLEQRLLKKTSDGTRAHFAPILILTDPFRKTSSMYKSDTEPC